jgi:Flp pilus assembly protein TadD
MSREKMRINPSFAPSTFTAAWLPVCALLPLLLLAGCASTPKPPATGNSTTAVDNNEPDLLAQLRERMASGQIKHVVKAPGNKLAEAKADTSRSPAFTVDPAKQQAAMAVAGDYAAALNLINANKDAEALALLQKVAAKAPQLSGPQVNQAIILLKQEKFADASTALQTAVTTNPRNPYAYNLLGIALRDQGKFTEAKTAYDSALAIDPNYAKAHFNYGVLADLYLQDLPLALTHYERYQALQSKPDPTVAHWITDLQKRTGVYKAPAPVALPPPAPASDTTETETPATAPTTATPAPAGAPATTPAKSDTDNPGSVGKK